MVQKSGQKVMTTMGKYHLKSCLTFACAPIPCEKKVMWYWLSAHNSYNSNAIKKRQYDSESR